MGEYGYDKHIFDQLQEFRRKFYLNKLLKGLLLLFTIVLSVFIFVTFLEFSFNFGKILRFIFFILLSGSFIFTFIYYILHPLLVLTGQKKGLSDEEAARLIGNSFPSIQDRLLNFLQLSKREELSDLVIAGIKQKSTEVSVVTFKSAIKWSENKKYLKYLLSPVSLVILLLIFKPIIFTTSTDRILHFNQDYTPAAPFTFQVTMNDYGFRNEDFEVRLKLIGSAIPENAYIIQGNRRIKLDHLTTNEFIYSFNKLQTQKTFNFEAAGFISENYFVDVYERPGLKDFNVNLNFPNYTKRSNERLSNTGNLEVPEGTKVNWLVSTIETESLQALFLNDSTYIKGTSVGNQNFEISKTFHNNENYILELENKYSKNKENLFYNVKVIKDQFPEISSNTFGDTILYSMVALAGNISDDYGLKKLLLHYTIIDNKGKEKKSDKKMIQINPGQESQAFYYRWMLDSIEISKGEQLRYYLEVWDNDQVNGSKASRSSVHIFKIPSKKEIKEEIGKTTSKTEEKAEESIEEAKNLRKKLEEAENKLKGKKQLNWEDQQLIKEILKEKEDLEKAIDELREMNRMNNMQRDQFSPQDEKLKEKARQLQELMDEVLDEETRKLYEELQKLLEENAGVDQVQDMLDKLSKKQNNAEKELERALELFKKLKLEHEINETIKELKEIEEDQTKLANETLSEKENFKELLEKQNKLNDNFKETENNIDKIQELNQELDRPMQLPDVENLSKEIEEEQNNAKENLEDLSDKGIEKEEEQNSKDKNSEKESTENTEKDQSKDNTSTEKEQSSEGEKEDNGGAKESKEGTEQNSEQEQGSKKEKQNSAGESQQKAGEKMKKMAEQMENMAAGMEMEMMMENLDDLKNIVHSLLKLSFDQESLFKEFREVNELDPRFVALSQTQLKLRDDSKVIEDSLISLSKRVFQLSSFITREVSEMNEHMEKSMDALKERKKYKAVSDQQFAMTSMNNLALLLDDVMDQMMDALSESSGISKGKKQNSPSLSELQQQLNQQIEKLKESGKTGRELSEELAKLAAEQARIREALKEMQRRLEGNDTEKSGVPGGDLPDKMESTEMDLVNKRLTEQMIRRQRDILTRLLEAENALREKEMDDERKGETANYYEKILPNAFEDYLKKKEQEIEMLKTVPVKLYPYYKKEVSDYFKRIGKPNLK